MLAISRAMVERRRLMIVDEPTKGLAPAVIEHLIAKEPLPERDASRLVVLDRQSGDIEHRQIGALPKLLAARDCVVFNNTRVLPARLLGHRAATGGKWEGLYLNRDADGGWNLIVQTRI